MGLLPTGMYTTDVDGRLTYYNRRAVELWGREPGSGPAEDRYCGAYRVYAPDGFPLPHEETPMALAVKAGRPARNEEVVIQRPDGTFIIASFNIDPLFDRHGRVAGAINVFLDISEQKRVEDELRRLNETLESRVRERTEQVEALSRALSRAEQKERSRISRMLHDDLQQLLFSIQMRCQTLEQEPEADIGEALRAVRDQAQQAVSLTRNLALDIDPPAFREGDLATALRWLSAHMQNLHGFTVVLEMDGEPDLDSRDESLLLLRTVRELLFNAKKHAGVDRARVRVYRQDGRLNVVVEDSGKGFDAGAVLGKGRKGRSIGFSNIEEGLRLLDGRLTVRTRPGQGTSIHIEVPARARPVPAPSHSPGRGGRAGGA